eukprot:CAMPEP_0180167248 /NCGR_PEP_ID=MMETSP0986-20121125/32024_1 /TAXON_ID=697907 /ORGANISM="non described non described, Strain CCMP2293" /LENGTH=33 /DNA_ID= /DNA_START= /DNA_END= /DNA_ORIENTATION=
MPVEALFRATPSPYCPTGTAPVSAPVRSWKACA